ncbi:hypothetical protein N8G13_00810 [Mycoplasma zalophi]|uniref:hypothetical protein n=1 Tax=Mycoplasma zalophi TaxID=191287 RepID=UPI0021C95006|nr:hypothetical protein [Mycoplasma zalophi]MCU4117004.1 hypothetical protein [Mycoplasma zalophi]
MLDIINENYEYIEFTKSNILTLHNQLYSYSHANYKGKFKTSDNIIIEADSFGNKKTWFEPVKSFDTENYIDNMILAYKEAIKVNIFPLF